MYGTLDLMILKTLSWGPRHGLAVLFWINEVTGNRLVIEEGALTLPCTGWRGKAGSRPSGESAKRDDRPSSISSPVLAALRSPRK